MRKSALTAAGLAMTLSMAGIAYAASPSGPTATDRSSVAHSAVDTRGRSGADDPAGHEARDDSRGRDPASDDVLHERGHFGIHRFHDDSGHHAGDDHGGSGSDG